MEPPGTPCLAIAIRANAAPNNSAVEGSGTNCEDWEGTDDGAVIELSFMLGTSSLRFRVASSSGNSNSSGGIVVGIGGMSEGCGPTKIPPPTGTALLGNSPAGEPSPRSGGAEASQGVSPAPVLIQTMAGATIFTAGAW